VDYRVVDEVEEESGKQIKIVEQTFWRRWKEYEGFYEEICGAKLWINKD
jgi:hypothetical protein